MTDDLTEVSSFAFGGSLIDLVFKTTPKAAERVRDRVRNRCGVSEATAVVRFRRCWTSDVPAGLAVLSLILALTL
ncbi:hypothetical protein [Streptomyces sp. NPDC101132]|uniref:hypothetical protein n=1 Tax=Streptomyces sp. NPDC101132 TaxID=3366110 RepID=UPI0038269110